MHTREDSGLRLDRAGRWWHDDVLVEHPKIHEAFNRGLDVTDDGRYILRFGRDWCFVHVEDIAFVVRGLSVDETGKLCVELSNATTDVLDPTSLELNQEGVLCCRVRGGRAKARFSRDAQFALGDQVEQRDGRWFLDSGRGLVALPEALLGAPR